ncbi:hypothetical protein FA15DRAFT_687403 [Coprinopsis marcescibilis]|uniref:DUF6593 domain-containing protein n=1 Tax=Coprinopsis marcescibilis TaxID=230819 RepID=A0A5C3KWT6_COPMA|nr:hypothetical protein FA15DRAFT_687403 [Coprinopsis marcescibilis]
MLYILSKDEPWNATYCTPEGQAMYKATSPAKLTGRKAYIDKIIPNGVVAHDMEDRFTRLAQIDFHTFTSSKITMGGITRHTDDIFRKKRVGWFGRDRIFQGPDGNEYRWELGSWKPELYLNDNTKTLVAKYHQKHTDVFQDARPASLEIFPPGENIPDMIIVTFVYIEYLRLAREETAEAVGG